MHSFASQAPSQPATTVSRVAVATVFFFFRIGQAKDAMPVHRRRTIRPAWGEVLDPDHQLTNGAAGGAAAGRAVREPTKASRSAGEGRKHFMQTGRKKKASSRDSSSTYTRIKTSSTAEQQIMMMRAWAKIVFGRRVVMAGKVCAVGALGEPGRLGVCSLVVGGSPRANVRPARLPQAMAPGTGGRWQGVKTAGSSPLSAGSRRGREDHGGQRRSGCGVVRGRGSGGWRPRKGAVEERCVREDAGCSRTAAARKGEVCKYPVVLCQDLPLRASRVCSVGPSRGLVMELVIDERMRCRASGALARRRIAHRFCPCGVLAGEMLQDGARALWEAC